MKSERLSVAVRLVAGTLAALMFLVAADYFIAFLQRGGPELLDRALAALLICGVDGVIFGLAAITGRSPDVLGMYAQLTKPRT